MIPRSVHHLKHQRWVFSAPANLTVAAPAARILRGSACHRHGSGAARGDRSSQGIVQALSVPSSCVCSPTPLVRPLPAPRSWSVLQWGLTPIHGSDTGLGSPGQKSSRAHPSEGLCCWISLHSGWRGSVYRPFIPAT